MTSFKESKTLLFVPSTELEFISTLHCNSCAWASDEAYTTPHKQIRIAKQYELKSVIKIQYKR